MTREDMQVDVDRAKAVGEEKSREYLMAAGFRSITTHRLAHDIQNNWYVVMK